MTGHRPSAPASRPATLTGGYGIRSARFLARGLRSQWRTFTGAFVATTVFALGTVGTGWALGRITDDVVVPAIGGEPVTGGEIWAAGAVLALAGLVTAAGVIGRRVLGGIAAFDLQAGFRRRVTRRYLQLPRSWHRRHPVGNLLSTAGADAEVAGLVFQHLGYALGTTILLGASSTLILLTDWAVGLAGLVVVPLILVAGSVFRRRVTPAVGEAQQARAAVSAVAHESLELGVLVKAMGAEAAESRRFGERSARLRAANARVGRLRAVFDPVVEALPGVGSLLVVAVGAARVGGGYVAVGEVVTAAYLLTIVALPVRVFGVVLADLPRSLVGYDRLARVLDAPERWVDGPVGIVASTGLAVRLEAVTVSAETGSRPLLDSLDLEIRPGTTVAVTGATGAGKSTLVAVLCRQLDPSAGRVAVEGVDLREWSGAARTSQIALVPQSPFVFDDTVRANVTMADAETDAAPASPSDEEVWQALRVAGAAGFVAELPDGLDSRTGEEGTSLSGGQRQRLAIARAVVRRPRMLVLDDATSAVDPTTEASIVAGLRALPEGTTLVLVASHAGTVELADEVVHLEGGRIAARGTHAQLLEHHPGYRALIAAYRQGAS